MVESIHPETKIGLVALSVGDLNRSLRYYQNGLGLKLQRREDKMVYLGAGDKDLLVLREERNGRTAPQTSGLYHFALLVPSRLELARVFWHLIQTRTPLSGFSDHAVSEAIYLTDPDGHGIEIYRDRPRHEWQYPGGHLKITVEPLDAEGLLGELAEAEPLFRGMAAGTVMGHIHLRVADIPAAEAFYAGVLGFEVMARYSKSAVFLAAGGYHHHLGMNTWAGEAVPLPPDDAWRLLWYEIRTADLTAVKQRLEESKIPFSLVDNTLHVADPSGNQIHFIQQA
jgi:catechol 2,3-dioxygenase